LGGNITKQISYLIIKIGSPKSYDSTIIRIRREDGGTRGPYLINVLNNDQGLTNGLVSMDQDWDFLMNRVGLEEKLTLRPKYLFKKLIVNRFDIKGNLSPHHIWACPCTQKLDITFCHELAFKIASY
jgi:hypothetical protein